MTMNDNHPTPKPYATDDQRWQAIMERDPIADGVFVYAVKTTGVYCRPTCRSKIPLRKNVGFHASPEAAERAGFRPCKRCSPSARQPPPDHHAAIVAAACTAIDRAEHAPSLEELASAAGLSKHHFHRLFKRTAGMTPKEYAMARRRSRIETLLPSSNSVTEAVYQAGYGSTGQYYESDSSSLGMNAKKRRAKGEGLTLRFAVGECSMGSILVAATDRGVCAILLGDDPEDLVKDLQNRFSNANLIGADASFEAWVATAIGMVDNPSIDFDLPLDLQGTLFQQRVWKGLQGIPPGSTESYRQVAERLGIPRSVRAVATACAANPIAVAIPCHRVVRSDGGLAGYRWGIARKAKLLELERGKE